MSRHDARADQCSSDPANWPVWAPNTRVRVRGTPSGITLGSPYGKVIGPDPGTPGAYLVLMERPYRIHNLARTQIVLLEDGDNLERMEAS